MDEAYARAMFYEYFADDGIHVGPEALAVLDALEGSQVVIPNLVCQRIGVMPGATYGEAVGRINEFLERLARGLGP